MLRLVIILLILTRRIQSTVSEYLLNTEQPSVYYKTLLEAGDIVSFKNQFKQLENKMEQQAGSNNSVAERILNDMDTNINPCENFYQFACGGFAKQNNSQSGNIFAFRSPESKITEVVKEQLNIKCTPSTPEPLRKAKNLYKSCLNENVIENRGLKPVLNFLDGRGGWPVLGKWKEETFDFISMMSGCNRLFGDPLVNNQPFGGSVIGAHVGRDLGKTDQYTVYLDTPTLGQFRIYNQPNHEVYRLGRKSIYNKAYEEYLVDIAIAFGADVATARKDMCDVVKFETELARNFLFEEERRQVLERYQKLSILELSMRYPQIDWLRYMREILSVANIKIDLSTKVVLVAEKYYDKLVKILSRTPKRTLANYILFRSIQPLLPTLPKHIQYISLRYNAVVNGATEPKLPERSSFCANIVIGQMDWLASRLFVQNKFDVQKLEYVTEILRHVRSVVTKILQRTPWVSSKTRTRILRKMNSITARIGYPKKLFDDNFLDNYYKKFDIGNNFFENMEEVLVENYRRRVLKLVRQTPEDWLLRPVSVNAVYIYALVSIDMPYGILDEPFFSKDYPPSMNFGGIGSLIAHEFAHGFDDTNININSNGIIQRFWTDFSVTNFKELADCLIRQYSNFFVPEASLAITNGNKTLNENIADNLGSRAAFYAYKKWKVTQHVVDDFVRGLPFNGDQLYFINFARQWCLSASNVFLRKYPLLENHALYRFRVIGPLQNMPEFSKTFNCPLGSSMNPIKKCKIW